MKFEVSGNLRASIYNFIQSEYGEVNDYTIEMFSSKCHLSFQNTKKFIFANELNTLDSDEYNEIVEKTTSYITTFINEVWNRYKVIDEFADKIIDENIEIFLELAK